MTDEITAEEFRDIYERILDMAARSGNAHDDRCLCDAAEKIRRVAERRGVEFSEFDW